MFIFCSFLSEVEVQGWERPPANQLLASGAGKWFTEWSGQTSGQSDQKKLLRMSLSSNKFFSYGEMKMIHKTGTLHNKPN